MKKRSENADDTKQIKRRHIVPCASPFLHGLSRSKIHVCDCFPLSK
ncbi:hypothetical protein T09_12165 [Trichinella sp. T9]|nr:hypothetical protein T09_14880 [Trichinella sp. T9]KRX57068.1 hypothetical protein T09_12165 [Trichinella sp. T9]